MEHKPDELSERIKKYIVTDPSFLLAEDDYYKQIREKLDSFNPIDENWLPFNTKYRFKQDSEPIIIYEIRRTNKGLNHNSTKFRDNLVVVETGLLCIAENKKGWDSETTGVTTDTLVEATTILPYLTKHL